jgi:hypothetical protein
MIQAASLLGAALILAAYAAHQSGRMGPESLAYHIVNAVGGAILFGVAVDSSQFGFIVLEGAWTVISLYAIARSLKRRARGA